MAYDIVVVAVVNVEQQDGNRGSDQWCKIAHLLMRTCVEHLAGTVAGCLVVAMGAVRLTPCAGADIDERAGSAEYLTADTETGVAWSGPGVEHLAGPITRNSLDVTGTTLLQIGF